MRPLSLRSLSSIAFSLAPSRRRRGLGPCMRAGVAFLGLCALLLGLGCGGNVNNNKFREGYGGIKGTLFLTDGSPAANARVQVINLPSIATTTDGEGRFQLDDIPAGRRELVLTHKKPQAARISVWVVHRFNVTLDASLAVLKPVGSLSGRISARPRLDAKGIQVVVKGMPYTTKTHNERGDFKLPALPEGCHILQISSPYFVRKEFPDVCVRSGQPATLPKSIALSPSVPCKTTTPSCAKGGLCIEGFCVPDPGGTVALQASGVQALGDVQFEMRSESQRVLLRNAGPGQVRILRFEWQNAGEIFQAKLPRLPIVLQKGEALSAQLSVYGAKLGEHEATLHIETDEPGHSTHQIKLRTRVLPHPSNCLSARPGTLELGELDADTPHVIEVSVANRCGQTLLIQAGTKEDPAKASCAPEWLGRFSMDVCLSSSQKLPVKVPPGEVVKLSFRLTPKSFGALTGELYLPHDETPGGRLQIPLKGFVKAPGLTLTPQPLDFGDVAPGEERTLWVQLRAEKPLSNEVLKALKFQVDASGATIFKPLGTQVARLPKDTRVVYIPISMKAPVAGRLLAGSMRVEGLPGLGQRPFILPLKARIAAAPAPILQRSLALGSTDGCTPPAQTLYLNNPSDAPIVVTNVELRAGVQGDFALRVELPVALLPKSRVVIATLHFTPSAKVMRAHGQLKVSIKYGDSDETHRIISLVGSTGYRVQEAFLQANSPNVDVLLYIDRDIDQSQVLPKLEGGLTTMLAGLNKSKVNYRVLPISGDNALASVGLSPLTPNPINELRRLLRPSTDASHHGLAALDRMLQRRNAPANTTTIAVFVARNDDRSPYAVTRYLPQPTKAPFAVFAALPQSQCAARAHRYEEAVSRSGGALLDLCTAASDTWRIWSQKIQRLAVGQRIQFPLQYTPKQRTNATLQLSTAGHSLPAEQWSYDTESNQVSLGHPAFLPPGQTLSISYYTQCQ